LKKIGFLFLVLIIASVFSVFYVATPLKNQPDAQRVANSVITRTAFVYWYKMDAGEYILSWKSVIFSNQSYFMAFNHKGDWIQVTEDLKEEVASTLAGYKVYGKMISPTAVPSAIMLTLASMAGGKFTDFFIVPVTLNNIRYLTPTPVKE
jgi:hypothetical protein